ncbi:MAG: hypothetical protein ACK4TF_08740 [Thermodesulfovibrionales bacterium]
MSPDEFLLSRILKAFRKVRLEAILIGNAGAALQGAPVMTQDIDFFVRDTELNRKKIREFAELLGLSLYKRDEAISEVITAEGKELIIDFIFRLTPDQKYESVRSRAKKIKIGDHFCLVANLEDIIKSKKVTGRVKDIAVIKLLEDTLKVKRKLKG